MQTISVIDSHTAGEPTRLVMSGGPSLEHGTLAGKLACLRSEHDWLRSSICLEPRASEAAVGAILCEPCDTAHLTDVIFFNNSGYLGMCGHATIGLMATMEYLGRITPGRYLIGTPVGQVQAELHGKGKVSVSNVASRRLFKDLPVEVAGYGTVHGDVAWGGNWFFLTDDPGIGIQKANLDRLRSFAKAIRHGLQAAGLRGDDGAEIDHIEIFGNDEGGADSRNFVLCPGEEYDRSPCGTGVSAKLACLHADGKLREGQIWRQAGILGGVFEGSVRIVDEEVLPTITGEAFVMAETQIVYDERDPYRFGIR